MPKVPETLQRVAALAPPRPPFFRGELWRRIDRAERRARRRRVAAALIGGALALAALTAGGVLAFGNATPQVVDRTVRCDIPDWGGVNVLDLSAHTVAPPVRWGTHRYPQPATVWAGITAAGGTGLALAAASTNLNGSNGKLTNTGYTVNSVLCRSAPAIPLAANRLPTRGLFAGTRGAGFIRKCWIAPTATIRLRVHLHGETATAAQLAVRSGAKLRPTAYIVWTPTRIRFFASPACNHTD